MVLLVAFLAAFFLPEALKATPRWRHLQNPGLHVLAGVLDIVAVAALHAWLLGDYLDEIRAASADLQASESLQQESGKTRVAVLMGTPALMVFAYLVKPLSLVLTACGLYGVMRALDAGFNKGFRASLPFEVLFWVGRRLGGKAREASEERALGEVRPDVLVPPEASASGTLELRCNRPKAFTEVQVVRYREVLFRIEARDDVTDGDHAGFCYRFRPLEAWENITGTVIEL